MKRIIISILTVITLGAITLVIIAYARGFRFNPKDREIAGTGLLVVKSKPDGAQVNINGELKTATNSTINLSPGHYSVRLVKEGFQPWKKEVDIQREVVVKIDAVLFPSNPGLSPLTTSGVQNPTLSPDGSAIAFIIKKEPKPKQATPSAAIASKKKHGIFILDLANRPLSFSRNPRQIMSFDNLPITHYSLPITIIWSPDAKQILAIFSDEENEREFAYLLNSQNLNSNLKPIESPQEVLALWEEQKLIDRQKQINSLPEDLIPLATSSAQIISFSPDESKFLYRAKRKFTIPRIIIPPLLGTNPTPQRREIEPDNLYVYDLKEDRNYLIGNAAKTLNTQKSPNTLTPNHQYTWFPTSSHLFYIEDTHSASSGQAKIKIMDFDASNKTTLYAGPFESDFLASWPDGSKLVILTTLNPDAFDTLNLYAVKLR
jgi:hypothetical protein